MKRKIFISFLIVVLAHYMIGCTIYDTVQVSDPKNLRESNRVHKLILHTGEIISFDQKPGELVYVPQGVTGTTESGEIVHIADYEIQSMLDRNMFPVTMDMLKSDTSIRIRRVEVGYSFVQFDKKGGRYVEDHSWIRGTTSDSNRVNIPFSEVKLALMDLMDASASLSSSFGLIVLLIVIGAGIYILLSDDGKLELKGGYIKPGFW